MQEHQAVVADLVEVDEGVDGEVIEEDEGDGVCS